MPGMVRISFGIYNTLDEVDMAMDALAQIARGASENTSSSVEARAGRYVQDRASGEFRAIDWASEPTRYFGLRDRPRSMDTANPANPASPAEAALSSPRR
jgi:hypothetical protein